MGGCCSTVEFQPQLEAWQEVTRAAERNAQQLGEDHLSGQLVR